jgi:hypothetical protein
MLWVNLHEGCGLVLLPRDDLPLEKSLVHTGSTGWCPASSTRPLGHHRSRVTKLLPPGLLADAR